MDIQEKIGLAPVLLEMQFFHMINLKVLESFSDWMIFKGGTAVQTYLPPTYQRASVDLDFNASFGHPEVIIDQFHQLNETLTEKECIVEIEGIPLGKFVLDRIDDHSGTITFFRILPTKFNLHATWEQKKIQGRKYRIQVNYKHSDFPARFHEKMVNPSLLPFHFAKPREPILVNVASVSDLLADKLLTVTKVKGFGRERIKDVYDLVLLSKIHGNAVAGAFEKLTNIARIIGVTVEEIISTAMDTLTTISEWHHEAQGFRPQVAVDGRKEILDNWTKQVLKTTEFLSSIFFNE